jgi:hypothetical protein
MGKVDPTKDPEFKRVLGNLLTAPPKPHADMKLGKATAKKAKSPNRAPSQSKKRQKQRVGYANPKY